MIPYSLNPMGFGDPYMSDLDILRQIRDANPTSQLPLLWPDSEDPYTQWDGVVWFNYKVVSINILSRNIASVNNIKKLSSLQTLLCANNNLASLDLSSNLILINLNAANNSITNALIPSTNTLVTLIINNNKLTSISSLNSKGNITNADFTHNKMPVSETDRLLAMGFTSAQVLPQDI